jgi:UDP:flavonoid glycosyltransferase YjiC (YdhE family)
MRHYLGPCIDFDRREPDFDWALLTPGRKLVYCALGTSGNTYPGAMAFLGRVVEALRGLDGWDVVLAAGDFYPEVAERIGRASVPHFAVVRDAPQLALLKRTDLMLTHGGLGSIKECIYFGVPMVVFPGSSDQIGNAARVAHHQLGVVGDLRRSSAADIRSLVTQVTSSAAIRANVARMQQAFVEADRDQAIRAVFDQLLDPRSSSRPPSHRGRLSAHTGA